MLATDAGEHEIVSTYYVDNQLASEEQKKQLLDYKYDPAGRTLETASENKETKAKTNVISHYAGSGNALTWTCEEEDKKECAEGKGKWSRNIPGIDGALDATQEAGKAPVLQLHDLQGNIVGTVEDKETVTKLASTYNSTEFGVPQSGTTPPKYAWLGAAGVSSEPSLGSGTSTEGGASYVPQVARSLQTAPVVPPGAFPDGQGTGSQDESVIPGWYISLSSTESAATQAAYQKKLEEEAKKKLEEEEQTGLREEYPDSPTPEGAPPGEEATGYCEVAMATNQEYPGCERISLGSSGGPPVASAAFYKVWVVEPSVAGALGWAIYGINQPIGHTLSGFVKIPSWLIEALDSRIAGGLNNLGLKLIKAGSLSTSLVTITVFGELKGNLWVDLEYEIDA